MTSIIKSAVLLYNLNTQNNQTTLNSFHNDHQKYHITNIKKQFPFTTA